ncbi:hypothetical protein ACE02Z_10495 [Shewanella xiamenensis]|uniref:hypothetical protein n=1 Tax=Shewanella xiamenensis TaxID=332186 RepID=UPI00313D8D2D
MDQKLLQAINAGFYNAKEKFHKQETISNQLISTIFVHEVSKSIHQTIFDAEHALKTIEVDDYFVKKPGEWLLDCCIVKTKNSFIQKIAFTLESESNTSKKSFDEDFAKILHINSDVKLYLNGLNQTTTGGINKYIAGRLEYAESILKSNAYETNNFYLGFWPSPKQEKKGLYSFWKCFHQHQHLDVIHLYKYINGKFMKITPS